MATWSSSRQLCGVYGGQFDLSSLPSNTWQIACVLYGGGCVLLGFSGLAALVCLLLPPHGAKRLACYTGYLQTMAGNIALLLDNLQGGYIFYLQCFVAVGWAAGRASGL